MAPDIDELVAMIAAGRYAELEAATRGLIESQPDAGIAWKALSVALTMQGKDPLDALVRAAALLPGDAEAHANLGNALLRVGRFASAVASYDKALDIKPDSADVHNNLGNALRGLGRLDDALASYRRALAIRPGFAEGYSNLGNALRALGRFDEAIDSYGKALELNPDYPEACNNLGNALLDSGRYDAAAASYRRAASIKSDFAEAHGNLGNALRALGRFEEAAAGYRRALAIDERFAGAHSNLGDVLRDLGQVNDAVASCRRAVELQPDLAGAHNSLGNALLDAGQLDAAAASYGQAVALRRDFTAAYINLGLVDRQRGAVADAESNCRRALELNPEAAPALVLQAELQADNGQFAAAEASFARAAAIAPDLPEAWAGIAHLRKMTPSDAAWAAHTQQLAGRLPPRQEVYLRFAIGKYFDDVKEYASAFGNYRRAHELMKLYAAPHDRRQLAQNVDDMIQRYDRQWASRIAVGTEPSRAVFIVGMPRSGTTLAEQILASHPAVFGAGELPFWSDAARGAVPGECALEYLRLLQRVSPDALRVIDKMPANFWNLGFIHEALPNARIIHLRRDPLDTCLSIYFQHFKRGHAYANDLDDLAHYYREYRRLMAHWLSVLPEQTILEVPYEGLVDDQEGWSRKMLQFVGLPWDERCMEFHTTRRSVMTASKWQVRQKMTRSSIERWRNYQPFLGPLLTLADVR
jgi:tetratricopeptide (TPR) repeat protein